MMQAAMAITRQVPLAEQQIIWWKMKKIN
jgi:hypothetical protein